MPRLFTGLEVPEKIADELSFLSCGVPGARWIDRENYHLTLRFIGDIDDAEAIDVAAMLKQITGPPLQLVLSGVGKFGARQPRSIWCGVEQNEQLQDLQARQERVCQMAGLAPEGRKFSPHVTLARLNSRVSTTDVDMFLMRHEGYHSVPFQAERFVLYSAKPSTGGGPYVIERFYDLA